MSNNLYNNKFKLLKKVLIKRIMKGSIIIISCAIISFALFRYEVNIKDHLKDASRSIINTQNSLRKIGDKKVSYKDSIKLWEDISDSNRKLNGIKIDKGQEIIKQLQEKYLIENVKVDFTIPEISNENEFKTQTVDVLVSMVTLSFNSISDQYTYAFINELSKKLPGYIELESVEFSRIGDVNEVRMIEIVKSGSIPTFVKSSIRFKWRDLSEKE